MVIGDEGYRGGGGGETQISTRNALDSPVINTLKKNAHACHEKLQWAQ